MTDEIADIAAEHFADVQQLTKAPNLAYGLYVDGRVIAEHDENRKFRIASMSKSFTAAAVLLLRDRGKLQLEVPVADLVPELAQWQLPTNDSPRITVRNLLTMSSGLATDDAWGDRLLDLTPQQMNELMLSGGHFAYPPGTHYEYSNYGIAILGRVITNVAGEQFQHFIKRELIDQLAMTSTDYSVGTGDFAQPHRIVDDSVVQDDPPLTDGEFAAGNGGIWTTVRDLHTWMQFMCDAFPARNGTDDGPLLRATRREMQQIQRTMNPSRWIRPTTERPVQGGYGMGLFVLEDGLLGHTVMHPGGLPGYGSCMVWLPERKVACVALANVTYAPMKNATFDLLELLERTHRLSQAQHFESQLVRDKVDQLIDLFNNWSDDSADRAFSMNVALDDPYDRRRARVQALTPFSLLSLKCINASNADATVAAPDGLTYRLQVSLSPEATPKIQKYTLTLARTT